MKASVSRLDFDKALGVVSRAVSSRSLGSYQQFVKLRLADGKLYLEATNDELYTKVAIAADVSDEGELLVGAIIADLVAKMTGDDVELAREAGKLTVKSGKSRYQLVCADAEIFPTIMDYTDASTMDMASGLLKDALKKTAFCAYKGSGERSSYYTSGVLFKFTPEYFDTVATDGHRLALKKTRGKFGEEQNDVLIPASNADELLRFLPDGEETIVRVYMPENHVFFEFDEMVVSSSMLDVKYPDYQRVIPSERATKVLIARKEFLDALRRVLIVSRAKQHNPVVRLRTEDSSMTIFTDATDVGIGEEDVPCETEGENLEIAVNPGFLVDMLNQLTSERVYVYWNSKVTPLVVSAEDDSDFTYVVMPIRIE